MLSTDWDSICREFSHKYCCTTLRQIAPAKHFPIVHLKIIMDAGFTLPSPFSSSCSHPLPSLAWELMPPLSGLAGQLGCVYKCKESRMLRVPVNTKQYIHHSVIVEDYSDIHNCCGLEFSPPGAPESDLLPLVACIRSCTSAGFFQPMRIISLASFVQSLRWYATGLLAWQWYSTSLCQQLFF